MLNINEQATAPAVCSILSLPQGIGLYKLV